MRRLDRQPGRCRRAGRRRSSLHPICTTLRASLSDAVALTAVLGGPTVYSLVYGFVLATIGIQSIVLLAAAIVFQALTGHRYPLVTRCEALDLVKRKISEADRRQVEVGLRVTSSTRCLEILGMVKKRSDEATKKRLPAGQLLLKAKNLPKSYLQPAWRADRVHVEGVAR
jgi:hypothetical protein